MVIKQCLKYIALCSLAFCVGCAQVPKSISLPWNRSLSSERIIPESRMSVLVECLSTPLLGSDQLVDDEIAATVNELLSRRGFIITEQNPKYKMKVQYQTEITKQKILMSSSYSSSSINTQDSGSDYSGLGVIFALAMATASASNTSYSKTIDIERDMYKHRLACEIYSESDQVIWQNETFIDSYQSDILSGYIPLLQIAFSALPTTNTVVPRVKKLNDGRLMNYANIYMNRKRFICPALPNHIRFTDSRYYNDETHSKADKIGISDPSAVMAYIDLLRTAEYAIPSGDEKDWKNPTEKTLWKKATLIGRYYLGQDEIPVNVVISLKGSSSCYTVAKCQLVSEAAYQQYLDKYNAWKLALVNYYGFFEE